jgi:hypothetical protein
MVWTIRYQLEQEEILQQPRDIQKLPCWQTLRDELQALFDFQRQGSADSFRQLLSEVGAQSNYSLIALQSFGYATTRGRLYDIFDYGTFIVLNIIAIAQFKVLELAEKRTLALNLICVFSWLSCFLVFLIEMNFSSVRNYNTIKRIFSDLNAYLLSFFIMCMTIYLEFMFKRA